MKTGPSIVFLIAMVYCLSSCSTPQETVKPVASSSQSNFDSSSYINPKDYGYNLVLKSDTLTSVNADTVFKPFVFKNGLDKLQQQVDYPSEALRKGIQGDVLLELYVDSTGTLVHVAVLQSPHEILSNSCIESVINATYNTSTLRGKPVNSYRRFLFHLL